jgi:hypothetical protein
MLDSTIELIKAISEMYEAKVENNEISQSLGNNKARLIQKSDIFTPNNHADRPYTMFDPTTKNNVIQLKSNKTLHGSRIGWYEPRYTQSHTLFSRDKHPEYRNLAEIFSEYYKGKKYFGNKSLILDEKRFDILYSNFQHAKSINPHLNINKLWDLYTISFDSN